MVVETESSWGAILGRLQQPLIVVAAVSIVVTLVERIVGFGWLDITPLALGFAAVPLTVGLAVRLWAGWSGYRQAATGWAEFLSQLRALGRRITVGIPESSRAKKRNEQRRRMVLRLVAIAYSMRGQLRGVDALDDLRPVLDNEEFQQIREARRRWMALVANASADLQQAEVDGVLSSGQVTAAEGVLDGVMLAADRCASLGHISTPSIWRVTSEKMTFAFAVALPVGLVTTMGWWTLLIAVPLAALWLMLDEVWRSIEMPYASTPDGLPLSSDCRRLDLSLRDALGEEDLSADPRPYGGVLN